jgi:hypothetical protein
VLVAHASNPSYLGNWDLEEHSSWPAQANSSWVSVCKTTISKWTGGVTQAEEWLLFKCKAQTSKASTRERERETERQRDREKREEEKISHFQKTLWLSMKQLKNNSVPLQTDCNSLNRKKVFLIAIYNWFELFISHSKEMIFLYFKHFQKAWNETSLFLCKVFFFGLNMEATTLGEVRS